MCRITVNGKQSAFSTKLDISASNWDLKYGRVLGKSREAQEVKGKLDKIRLGIKECYSTILKNEGAVNSVKLKNTFLGMESGELTFFKFYEQFLSIMRKGFMLMYNESNKEKVLYFSKFVVCKILS